MTHIILFQPLASREYGIPEVVGPFATEEEAREHLANNVTLEDGWTADVLPVENPYAERA